MALARRLVTVLAVANVAVLGGAIVAAAVKDDGSTSPSANAPAGPATPSAAAPTSAVTTSSAVSLPSSGGPHSSSVAVSRPHVPVAAPTHAVATAGAPTRAPVAPASVATSAPASHHPSSAKPSPSKSAGAGTVGAKPGSYPETTTGTITVGGSSQPANGTSTLVVNKPQGRDQTQSTKSDQSTSEETARFGTDGSVHLTYLHIANQAFDETFHFAKPEPILPANPAPGTTYSWTATSDDGKTTLSYQGTIKGTENVTIGGTVVHCIVIHSTLKMTGGANVSVDETDDYAPAYKLIVREHQVATGKYSVVTYTADITTTLSRLTPK